MASSVIIMVLRLNSSEHLCYFYLILFIFILFPTSINDIFKTQSARHIWNIYLFSKNNKQNKLQLLLLKLYINFIWNNISILKVEEVFLKVNNIILKCRITKLL